MDTIHFIAVCILGLLGIYGAAALKESARDHAQEIRKALPTRPAKLLVTMVSMYGIGHRPWWRVPSRYDIPMYRQVRERAGLLQ